MDRICDFLMDNISNLTSSRNIAQSLTNYNDKINHKMVGNNLEYLCYVFAFYKFRRYEIKGKNIFLQTINFILVIILFDMQK